MENRSVITGPNAPGVAAKDLVIRTQRLTKRYGRILAVDQLSLEVLPGSVFGLLGPNGSGKTTVMGMLLGLVRPTSGTYHLFGPDLSQNDALQRIGALIETPSFYPYLSGRQKPGVLFRASWAVAPQARWTASSTGWA